MVKEKFPIGIYVHWPFCQSKCPYCDFNSFVFTSEPNEDEWLKAYSTQLKYFLGLISQSDYTLQSIFFGGGTPSLMNPRLVDGVVSLIVNSFATHDSNLEITLECNPSSSEAWKFGEFKEAGVNRLSIGVQALNDVDLHWLGRLHSASEAIKALEMASSMFDNWSMDLIYGRCNQTPQQWEEELNMAISFGAGHMSCYALTLEEGTKFTQLYRAKRLTVPAVEVYEDMDYITSEVLRSNNLKRYEVSNYAKNGFECRHNLLYWQGHDYIGIGPGAHGRIGNKNGSSLATVCTKAPQKWLHEVFLPQRGVEISNLSAQERNREKVLMGVRCIYGTDFLISLDRRVVQKLKEDGFLADNSFDKFIAPTQKGILFANKLAAELLL